jgi:hypothetical protein
MSTVDEVDGRAIKEVDEAMFKGVADEDAGEDGREVEVSGNVVELMVGTESVADTVDEVSVLVDTDDAVPVVEVGDDGGVAPEIVVPVLEVGLPVGVVPVGVVPVGVVPVGVVPVGVVPVGADPVGVVPVGVVPVGVVGDEIPPDGVIPDSVVPVPVGVVAD